MQQVAPTSNRPLATRFYNRLAKICVTSAGPQDWAIDALSLPWEGLIPCAFPPAAILGKVVEEFAGLPMQENHSDCSGVAGHALVLRSSSLVQPNPTEPAQPANTTIQSDS